MPLSHSSCSWGKGGDARQGYGHPREGGSNLHGGIGRTVLWGYWPAPLGLHLQKQPHHPSPAVAEGSAWVRATRLGQHVGHCGLCLSGAAWGTGPQPAHTCRQGSTSSSSWKVLRVLCLPCSFSTDSNGRSYEMPTAASGFQPGPSTPPGPMSLRPVPSEEGPPFPSPLPWGCPVDGQAAVLCR